MGIFKICAARRAWAVVAPAAFAALLVAATPAAVQADLILEPVANSLDRPTNVVHAGDGTGRTFVTEQSGTIRVYHGHDWTGGTVFLDIAVNSGGEQGLLGIAFHPQYESNGFFYIYHTDVSGDHNLVVRYHATGDVADPLSRTVILSILHDTATNHNGGRIEFGLDGYLYIAVGDGGNTPTKAQDLTSLLGKILRIDVDSASAYGIPPSNPFAGSSGSEKKEIWAYGVRNPWRISIDRTTNDLFIADVGQNTWEEVNFQPAGAGGGQNYGWNIMEGAHCYPPPGTSCSTTGLVLPIAEYSHGTGSCSITGGLRVHGPNLPSFTNKFIYTDYCSGHLWVATQVSPTAWSSAIVDEFGGLNVSSFGEDESGDVYIAAHGTGVVYRLSEDLPILTVADATVTEGNSGTRPAVFMATLSKPSSQPVSVPYSTMPGSAGTSDFVASSGTLTIPAGATTGSISIQVLGDVRDEPNEGFLLTLDPPTGATLSRTMAQGTILDDDGTAAIWRPIETVPFVITAQGSYRLTRNVSTSQASGAAITIASDFVTLDLGGFKIGGGGVGAGTTTVGVYALDRRNLTIRNGSIRGFLGAIFLEGASSAAHLVERIRADGNTQAGIVIEGAGSVVRRNQIMVTGGTTAFGANADTFGIRTDGVDVRILDNDVSDTVPVGSGTGYEIFAENAASTVIEKNRVGNAAPVLSAGIFAASGANVLVMDNRLTGVTKGVVFDAATGKYRANLTSGVITPYTGGTDAGGNE
jgi:glucose/arabinose dehydrogenase